MKWRKETRVYMFANYYSEDGQWKSWDEYRTLKGQGRGKHYDPVTKKMERDDVTKHFWKLENLLTGEVLPQEFKTLKEAKAFAES